MSHHWEQLQNLRHSRWLNTLNFGHVQFFFSRAAKASLSEVHRSSRQYGEIFFPWPRPSDHLQQPLSRTKKETFHLELVANALRLCPCYLWAARIPDKELLGKRTSCEATWLLQYLVLEVKIVPFFHILSCVAGDTWNDQNALFLWLRSSSTFCIWLHMLWINQFPLLQITISDFSRVKGVCVISDNGGHVLNTFSKTLSASSFFSAYHKSLFLFHVKKS